MNKIKIGKFLKSLKNEKKYRNKDLINEFEKKSLSVTDKGIRNWEKGISVPNIENLVELSKIYEITIDEILDGERINNIDLESKYFIYNDNWMDNYNSYDNLYEIRQKQIILINKRFNELLNLRISNDFTYSEEKEFKFLFQNFYNLNYCDKEEKKDDYLYLKKTISQIISNCDNLTNEDIIWEIKKFIKANEKINFNFRELSDYALEHSYVSKRFKNLESWEKDMMLAIMQENNPIIDYDKHGSAILKNREKEIGKEYDKDEEFKNIIKFMITNGAYLNSIYMNYYKVYNIKVRLIDEIEKYYNLYIKPLTVIVCIDDKYEKYIIENTSKNRFICKYYKQISYYFDYSIDQLYQMISKNSNPTKKMIIDAAKKQKVDINRNISYIKADMNVFLDHAFELWSKFRLEEIEMKKNKKNYNIYISKLKNGKKYINKKRKKFIGGKTIDEITNYCYQCNAIISRSEFIKGRKKNETEELLKNIDNMSIEEIKKSYFKK